MSSMVCSVKQARRGLGRPQVLHQSSIQSRLMGIDRPVVGDFTHPLFTHGSLKDHEPCRITPKSRRCDREPLNHVVEKELTFQLKKYLTPR